MTTIGRFVSSGVIPGPKVSINRQFDNEYRGTSVLTLAILHFRGPPCLCTAAARTVSYSPNRKKIGESFPGFAFTTSAGENSPQKGRIFFCSNDNFFALTTIFSLSPVISPPIPVLWLRYFNLSRYLCLHRIAGGPSVSYHPPNLETRFQPTPYIQVLNSENINKPLKLQT